MLLLINSNNTGVPQLRHTGVHELVYHTVSICSLFVHGFLFCTIFLSSCVLFFCPCHGVQPPPPAGQVVQDGGGAHFDPEDGHRVLQE